MSHRTLADGIFCEEYNAVIPATEDVCPFCGEVVNQ